jgi:prevent-host-death family protein
MNVPRPDHFDTGPNTVYILSTTTKEEAMQLSEQVKPISYLKTNASKMLADIGQQQVYVITQNGEAKAVLQSLVEYERTQETLAILKLVAMGKAAIAEGKGEEVSDAFSRIREGL